MLKFWSVIAGISAAATLFFGGIQWEKWTSEARVSELLEQSRNETRTEMEASIRRARETGFKQGYAEARARVPTQNPVISRGIDELKCLNLNQDIEVEQGSYFKFCGLDVGFTLTDIYVETHVGERARFMIDTPGRPTFAVSPYKDGKFGVLECEITLRGTNPQTNNASIRAFCPQR